MKKIGLVKWFNAQKGYGFIQPVDGGFDVYVHIKFVNKPGGWIKEGQRFCFDSGVDERTGEIFAEHLSMPPGSTLRGGSTPVDRRGLSSFNSTKSRFS